jgi:hypothetical protein
MIAQALRTLLVFAALLGALTLAGLVQAPHPAPLPLERLR